MRSGLNQINIANLNTKEFQEGLFKEIDEGVFRTFFNNDWPRDILFNVLVHKIRMNLSSDRMVGKVVGDFCNSDNLHLYGSMYVARCGQLVDDFRFLRENCGPQFRKIMSRQGRYFNSGDNKCDQLMFQIFISELRILGFNFEEKTTKSSFREKKKTETKQGGMTVESIVFSEKGKSKTSFVWKIGTREINGQRPFSGLGNIKIRVELRSPHAMIQYLGALIRAQLLIQNRFTPTIIHSGDFLRVPLFVVRRGALGKVVSGAIAVKHEGATYYIPRPNYGDPLEDRSLQVLDLINQIIIQQTTKADLPKSSTIQLVD